MHTDRSLHKCGENELVSLAWLLLLLLLRLLLISQTTDNRNTQAMI